jgi:hypothetical protein
MRKYPQRSLQYFLVAVEILLLWIKSQPALQEI